MAKMALRIGEWFMYSIDTGIPSRVSVFTGCVSHRKKIREISRFQAMALSRWHRQGGVYHSFIDCNGRWHDVRVVGDIEEWYGWEDE